MDMARKIVRRSLALLTAGALSCLAPRATAAPLDDSAYAAVLSKYVNAEGLVNYKALKAAPAELTAFIRNLGSVDPAAYAKGSANEQVAFWINAYNALTLQAIVDHYPIQSSWWSSRFYPKNSIRQISGVWDKLKFDVMGKPVTLDEIEHQILRKQFHEPRIHMALVCAAMGCPPLRNEPYEAAKLDAQFADQARKFLRNPKKFSIDAEKKRVEISPIFKWFGEDFVPGYGATADFQGRSEKERAVLNFIAQHAEERDARFLRSENDFTLAYKDYDWSLNEQ